MAVLDFLPEVCGKAELADLLLAHVAQISEYCGEREEYVVKILSNFATDALLDEDYLHNPKLHTVIQFSQEGVLAYETNEFESGWAVNPREVVRMLSLALSIVEAGWGRDKWAVLQDRTAISMTFPKHMTFDWQGVKLFPAFRYRLGITKVDPADVRRIVAVIQDGRKRQLPPVGGIVSAGRYL